MSKFVKPLTWLRAGDDTIKAKSRITRRSYSVLKSEGSWFASVDDVLYRFTTEVSAKEACEKHNADLVASALVDGKVEPMSKVQIDSDYQMTKFLENVQGVVEASREEQSNIYFRAKDRGLIWVSNNAGYAPTIGHFGNMPICLSLFTAVVGGFKILFVDQCSMVTHSGMTEDWLKANLPKSAFRSDGYLNMTDATNWSNVINRAQRSITESAVNATS